MPKQREYPVVTITKDELDLLYSVGGYAELFPRIRHLSEDRGLIYHGPKKNIFKDVRFKAWFDGKGNLLQQNYIVNIAEKQVYAEGTAPRNRKGKQGT